ncbi:COA8 family protein CBG23705, mitochondrial-like isoform X2 [Acropora millepora]|uniref:COA8 family protein CBG23705, mitochondrial-like isoform X2 n=1 Tax=Acropora millepora TaxID=45264 RepID=UPI001CF46A90|nr:COA8 family protein CBG23705, mitochondrial-like isoform X2 [Acropora millepora]
MCVLESRIQMNSISRNKALKQLCRKDYFLNTTALLNKRRKSDDQEEIKTAKNSTPHLSPTDRTFNLVGPRDQKSNIRKIIYVKTRNEKVLEKRFREYQEELNTWHQAFWEKQNGKFYQSKKAFLQLRGRDINADTKKDFADDLSRFYKNFLDGHYQAHYQYLRAWYWRNFQLLWIGLQVSTARFIDKFIPWR